MSRPGHLAYLIVRRIEERDAGVTLVLDGTLPAEPGQFVMAWLPGVEERPLAVMDDAPLSLTICEVGPFTCAVCALQPGDRLWIRGPFGRGFPRSGRRHLLVGGGSGIAALTLLAARLIERGDEVRVVLGARTADQLMLGWRFEALGCRLVLATDDGSEGLRGTALDAAADAIADGWPDAVYGAGPEPMLRALAESAVRAHIPCWVSLEAVMRCGIGVCGSCHCGDKLVCVDGPVFAAGEVF